MWPGPVSWQTNVAAGSSAIANENDADVAVVESGGPEEIVGVAGPVADCSYAPASHGCPRWKPRWSKPTQKATMSTAGLRASNVSTSV